MARTPQIDPRGTGNAELIADPANPLYKVNFKHIATNERVSFTAWVTDFSDNFSSQWNEETVYGRMDPLAIFQGTQRNISMGLDVVAANKFEAINNTAKVDKLLRFLYPVYETGTQEFHNTLKAPPLLEMEWVNFVVDASGDGGSRGTRGLVGYLRNLSYTPVFESGLFLNNRDGSETNLFPQQLRLQLDFKVIHTHLVGWHGPYANGVYVFGGGKAFPHDAGDETANNLDGNCVDGPWIPDSAINTSQDQRTRRLMMEEQAANSEILGAHAVAGGARRRKRRELAAMQGHDFNRGCEDTEARIGRYDLNALQRQQDRQGKREKRAALKASRPTPAEKRKAANDRRQRALDAGAGRHVMKRIPAEQQETRGTLRNEDMVRRKRSRDRVRQAPKRK